MAKFDDEVLTMSRCRRMLCKHDRQARLRMLDWLQAVVSEPERFTGDTPPPKAPDPRQMAIPGSVLPGSEAAAEFPG